MYASSWPDRLSKIGSSIWGMINPLPSDEDMNSAKTETVDVFPSLDLSFLSGKEGSLSQLAEKGIQWIGKTAFFQKITRGIDSFVIQRALSKNTEFMKLLNQVITKTEELEKDNPQFDLYTLRSTTPELNALFTQMEQYRYGTLDAEANEFTFQTKEELYKLRSKLILEIQRDRNDLYAIRMESLKENIPAAENAFAINMFERLSQQTMIHLIEEMKEAVSSKDYAKIQQMENRIKLHFGPLFDNLYDPTTNLDFSLIFLRDCIHSFDPLQPFKDSEIKDQLMTLNERIQAHQEELKTLQKEQIEIYKNTKIGCWLQSMRLWDILFDDQREEMDPKQQDALFKMIEEAHSVLSKDHIQAIPAEQYETFIHSVEKMIEKDTSSWAEHMRGTIASIKEKGLEVAKNHPNLLATLLAGVTFGTTSLFLPGASLSLPGFAIVAQRCALAQTLMNLFYSSSPELKKAYQNTSTLGKCLQGTALCLPALYLGGAGAALQTALFSIWKETMSPYANAATWIAGQYLKNGSPSFADIGVAAALACPEKTQELALGGASMAHTVWTDPIQASKNLLFSFLEVFEKIGHAIMKKEAKEALARIASLVLPLLIVALLIAFPPHWQFVYVIIFAIIASSIAMYLLTKKCDSLWPETTSAFAARYRLEIAYRLHVKNCKKEEKTPLTKQQFIESQNRKARDELYDTIKKLCKKHKTEPLQKDVFEALVDKEERIRRAPLAENTELRNALICYAAKTCVPQFKEGLSNEKILEMVSSNIPVIAQPVTNAIENHLEKSIGTAGTAGLKYVMQNPSYLLPV